MPAEDDDAERTDHGKAQGAGAAAGGQVVQNDLRPRPLKCVGQYLRLPCTQIPAANPIGNRLIVDPRQLAEVLHAVGDLVADGARLDLANHGRRYEERFGD